MKNLKKLLPFTIAACLLVLFQNCKKVTEETSCTFPAGLTVSAITNTSIDAAWQVAEDAGQYLFEYRKAGTTNFTAVRVPAGTTTASVTGLAPGTTYEYNIQTNCSGSNSLFSPINTFTTLTDKEFNILNKWRLKLYKEDGVTKSLVTNDNMEFKKDGLFTQEFTGATPSGTWVFIGVQDSVKIIAGTTKTWKINTLTTSAMILTKASQSGTTIDSIKVDKF